MNCDEVCDELRAKLAEKEAELAAAREALSKIMNLTTYGDISLFSESNLYELLGKQDARTIRAMMRKLAEILKIDTDKF
jgi:hypothetical protein